MSKEIYTVHTLRTYKDPYGYKLYVGYKFPNRNTVFHFALWADAQQIPGAELMICHRTVSNDFGIDWEPETLTLKKGDSETEAKIRARGVWNSPEAMKVHLDARRAFEQSKVDALNYVEARAADVKEQADQFKAVGIDIDELFNRSSF